MTTTGNVVVMIEPSQASGRALLRGIADYSARQARRAYLWECVGSKKRWSALPNQAVKGLILHDFAEVDAARPYELPTVVIGHLPTEIPGVVNVVTDCDTIGRMAADHLRGCGFKHFAFCGYTTPSGGHVSWSEARHLSFRGKLAKAGVAIGATKMPMHAIDWAGAKEEIISWLHGLAKPVGIFACNDECGRRILEACRLSGLSVPRDVGVLGADNDEFLCELTEPPLSSIAIDFRRAGYEAAKALDHLIEIGKSAPDRIVTNAMHVFARRSTNLRATPNARIRNALAFIRANACHVVTVGDVASISGLSRRGLGKSFRTHLGRTVLEEIRLARTDHIARLLVETSLTVREISDMLGFRFQHFSRYFRSVKGLSPTDFRVANRSIGPSRIPLKWSISQSQSARSFRRRPANVSTRVSKTNQYPRARPPRDT